ncbi:MAG: heavy-metal-associated domain-containing protein [Prevotella sp.]|nr:heavy-metal-associated domain-containing protein [Bacteroides sp.]MCM1367139.1 heavy-metal-associated domain-containing protein [Prevotella sp.]MCM1437569.1 heavy-metal-associated domain-containing protein [Prevotella sp.]
MKFKTNAKCQGCASAIRSALAEIAPAQSWDFDLQSPDKTMTYKDSDNDTELAAKIISAVEKAGFKAELI